MLKVLVHHHPLAVTRVALALVVGGLCGVAGTARAQVQPPISADLGDDTLRWLDDHTRVAAATLDQSLKTEGADRRLLTERAAAKLQLVEVSASTYLRALGLDPSAEPTTPFGDYLCAAQALRAALAHESERTAAIGRRCAKFLDDLRVGENSLKTTIGRLLAAPVPGSVSEARDIPRSHLAGLDGASIAEASGDRRTTGSAVTLLAQLEMLHVLEADHLGGLFGAEVHTSTSGWVFSGTLTIAGGERDYRLTSSQIDPVIALARVSGRRGFEVGPARIYLGISGGLILPLMVPQLGPSLSLSVALPADFAVTATAGYDPTFWSDSVELTAGHVNFGISRAI